MQVNHIIAGVVVAGMLLAGCGRSSSESKSTNQPPDKRSFTVAPPSKIAKVTFGNTENGPLQFNGNPFFLPTFDSSGHMSEGFDISDTTLDASGIAQKPYALMIGVQTSNDRTGYEVRLDVTPATNVFYISADRIVVPAQSAVVPGDGPFITLNLLEGQMGSAAIVNGTVEVQQGSRKWSADISPSGLLLAGVELLPITCRVTGPAYREPFTYLAFPVFRGGRPGLITYTLYH
jgi:hypothetical protein